MKNFIEKNKKSIVLGSVTLLIVVAAIGTTFALFRSETTERVNTFSQGNVTTELVERFIQNSDTEYTKEPMVANTGASDCYVRMRMEITPSTAEANLIIGGLQDSAWQYADGWYYYPKVLEPKQTTSPLFTSVTIKDLEQWIDFDIILYQESVQVIRDKDGNAISDMETIQGAFANY